MEKKEPWYVYGIVSVISAALTYVAFTDYESFIRPDSLGSGKSNKLFLLIFNVIDNIGGRWFVLLIMVAITLLLIYKTFRRLSNRRTQ